jgi:hypothetical protein
MADRAGYVCCYCKRSCEGEAPFCVPEGFPRDADHEGKPLCEECGGSPKPTLDEICARLDREKLIGIRTECSS